ncbi:MAG: secretin and TonB N-terminal domain-containing protein [Deltaproteobacteria bacterium]|nr:secretin and TonB N-terminal domain-containing protein [Deltaproteobacteria bacterium]
MKIRLFLLAMLSFSPLAHAGYTVEFRDAGLKEALRLLARAADLNIILPEDLPGKVTVNFKDITLFQAFQSILKVNSLEYAIEEGIYRVGKPDQFAGGADLKTALIPLKYATAKDLVEKIKPLLSDKGIVVSEDRSNSLNIKDRDYVLSNVRNFVALIDKKDAQVLIEGKILDASNNFTRSLGIQWGVNKGEGRTRVGGVAGVGVSDAGRPLDVNLPATGPSGAPTSGIGLVIGQLAKGTNIDAQITASERKGDVRIISRPSVTTVNNMPAKIRSGLKIYVKSTSNINIATSGGSGGGSQNSLQEINTGVELTVTPQISIDDHIKLKIDAVESEADFTKTVDGIPAVIDNNASTTVLLKNGETTVIGGLFRVKSTKTRDAVPFISYVPVVGWLFQGSTKTRTNSELMIFITPKILGDT